MKIDRKSPVPLYYQLKESLLQEIQAGTWVTGDKLPTEDEISRQYNISRTTIRQALRDLELNGIVYRQAGKGTFLTNTKYVESPSLFDLEMSEFNVKGLQVSWKVVQAEEVKADENVAKTMGVDLNTRLFCLERIRYANEFAVGHTSSYVTMAYRDQIDLDLAETAGTMYYLSKIDMSHCTAEHFLEAFPADRKEVNLLGLEKGAPVLVVKRLIRNEHGTPFEFFRGVYRWDRFRYHIQPMPVII